MIATKAGLSVGEGVNDDGLSRRHIHRQIEASLARLGTDYINVYYIHRLDEHSPVKETMSALTELVEDGRVHSLGASTMAACQLATLNLTAEANDLAGINVVQPPVDATLNNWKRYDGFDLHSYLDVCATQNLGVCPYSPLAGGFLTRKYRRGSNDPSDVVRPDDTRGDLLPDVFERKYLSKSAWAVLDELRAIADELDVTTAQVALRWVMEQDVPGGTVPIVGARTPDQLTENAAATELILDEAYLDRIDQARGERLKIDRWPTS